MSPPSPSGTGAYKGLVLLKSDAEPILAALGLDRSSLGSRLTTVKSPRALQQHLSAKRGSLGFLRADQVDPSVRALSWGNKSLFGNDRVKSLAKWPLTARLQAPEGAATAYDPGQAWTLAAGGDILLDRGVSLASQRRGARRRPPVRRRHGEHHGTLQGLLPDGLGPALHEEDRQRRHRA